MSFSWKKLAIVTVCSVVGVVLALGGIAFAIYRYEHPSTPPKDWPAIDLPMLGLRAHLHTEMRTGNVAYMYFIEPLTSRFSDDFARVANDSTIEKSFDITLRDKGGFQLCREDVTTFVAGFDDAGKAGQLASEGTISCPAHDYLDATHWQVTWKFPKLSENNPMQTPAVLPKPKPRRVEADGELDSFSREEGVLTTKAGSQFLIDKSMRREVSLWPSPAGSEYNTPLHYVCEPSRECTIENRWNGRTVTARLIKSVSPD
jgi:hypothetical protein